MVISAPRISAEGSPGSNSLSSVPKVARRNGYSELCRSHRTEGQRLPEHPSRAVREHGADPQRRSQTDERRPLPQLSHLQ